MFSRLSVLIVLYMLVSVPTFSHNIYWHSHDGYGRHWHQCKTGIYGIDLDGSVTGDKRPTYQTSENEHGPHAPNPKVNCGTSTNTGNSPPPTTITDPIVDGGGPAPTVESTVDESVPTTGTSSPQPVVSVATSAPQVRQPSSPLIQRLRVTEYMVRDWGGKGLSNLPQWIELYNPSTEAVNLKGWTFQYATRRFANTPIKVHTLTLADTEDGFSIAGGGVALLTIRTLPAWRFSGIEADQVYNLNIENVLKRGWVLTDAGGTELQRIGRDAFSALSDPVSPPHQDGARVSHQVYPSEAPPESYYYGHSNDMGSPGFYEQPAPAAPSLVRRKLVGTWANLKRIPEKF